VTRREKAWWWELARRLYSPTMLGERVRRGKIAFGKETAKGRSKV